MATVIADLFARRNRYMAPNNLRQAQVPDGATVIPQAVFDGDEVMARIGRDRVSVLPGPPTLLQGILNHPDRAAYDLSSLRLTVTGAAAIPVSMIERMRSELTFRTIITAYGLTEASPVLPRPAPTTRSNCGSKRWGVHCRATM